MDIIKVASGSRTAAVAGAIARAIRERGKVHVRAIGVGAVNQAVKAERGHAIGLPSILIQAIEYGSGAAG